MLAIFLTQACSLIIHPFGKPGGGEVAVIFGLFSWDAGQHGARLPLARLLIGQGEDP